jgi:hypothetical protein
MLLSFLVMARHISDLEVHFDRRRAQCRVSGFGTKLRWWLKAAVRNRRCGVTIGRTDTRYPARGQKMRIAATCAALLLVPVLGLAKGQTARIEILHGKKAFVTLSGKEEAGQFTIWSGPGTSMTAADGTVSTPTSSRDFADWQSGVQQLPRDSKVYKVRFYCAAPDEPVNDKTPTHLCYGVRYAISREGAGFIQIPAANDKEFKGNTQSIYRGVEGSWFRASPQWEALVRPRIDEALTAAPVSYYQQPIYVPSRTAVGASPSVTPKH